LGTAREDNCLWCAGADAHQEEGSGESREEDRATVPRAITNEGARSAGKPVNVAFLITILEHVMQIFGKCWLIAVVLNKLLLGL
jgi:hypothetical protein